MLGQPCPSSLHFLWDVYVVYEALACRTIPICIIPEPGNLAKQQADKPVDLPHPLLLA
jgi:hypothetical protein